MIYHSITTLAINPGTKYIGLAVFQSSDLIYWGIRVLKGKWSEAKMKNAEASLENLINQYHVDVLVLKRLHSSRTSGNLNSLVRAMKRLARRKQIRLCYYSLADLKESLMVGIRANKMAIAGAVVIRYPFLVRELQKEKRHKHPYFVRMFEAVAAGAFVCRLPAERNCQMAKTD